MHPSRTSNSKYTVNSEYFSTIDTQDKAYWLGFLWADGNISRTDTRVTGPNRMRLSQKVSKKQHLEKFRDAIESNHNIKEHLSKSARGGPYKSLNLDINSRRMCETLEDLGFGTKDERIYIPSIPQELIPHFIRGYFDGDGCLSVYFQNTERGPRPKQEWSLTGNETLLLEIKDELNKNTSVSQKVDIKTYKRTNTAIGLRYGARADIYELYEYLYKNANTYLEEKHSKFIEFFARDENGPIPSSL